MKITITRGELKIAVNGFTKIIPGRPHIPVLGCVRFAVVKGDLVAQATDLDQTATFRFDNAEAEGDGEIIVGLQVLRDLSKGAGGEAITLENEGASITVANHVGGHTVSGVVEAGDPRDWPPDSKDITVSEANGFLAAYRRMAPFASVDETRRVLCGVHIDVKGTGDHNATIVATDGRRLTCCNSLKLPIDDKDGLTVPVTKFLLWSGLPEEVKIGASTAKDGTRFGLAAGQWTYRVRTLDGIYPNWRQVIPASASLSNKIAFTDAEVEGLRKIIPSLPGGEDLTLQGENGGLSLCGSDGGGKTLTVPLTAGTTCTGPGCRIVLNRDFLLQALNAGFRNFLFAGTHSPLLSEDGQGGTHVLMPLRVTGESRPAQSQAPVAPEAASENPIQQPETAQPEPEQPKENTKMNHENQTRTTTPTQANVQEPTALERLQAAYDVAKSKVREASQALADVADAIKLAAKEDRQRRSEVESVRAGLQKLQAIKV